MAKEKAILIEKNGARHEVEIEGATYLGVIIRQDTRRDPPTKVFRYANYPRLGLVPTFDEVDVGFLDSNEYPNI